MSCSAIGFAIASHVHCSDDAVISRIDVCNSGEGPSSVREGVISKVYYVTCLEGVAIRLSLLPRL